MTTLQEAIAAIQTLKNLGYTWLGGELWKPPLGSALAQKERPDFMAGYDAGMADAKRMALAQQGDNKNCPQPEICGSKECEFCRDTAAPAPQAQSLQIAKPLTQIADSKSVTCRANAKAKGNAIILHHKRRRQRRRSTQSTVEQGTALASSACLSQHYSQRKRKAQPYSTQRTADDLP